MKVKQILFSFLAASWLFAACSEKEPCCDGTSDYSKGIFVVNEGPWGGTGTISWHNPDTGETQDSLFEKANNGAVLGQFVQSLIFHNGKGYIVVNGANRVVVVNAKTFKFLDTIGGLALPRYFLPLDNNTAYVSQWGFDGLTGSVAKVDLNTHQVLKIIPTGHGPEKMVRAADRVYVANSGGYGKDSTLTEILLSDDSPQTLPIPSGINPSSLVWDNRQSPAKLFYLCKGYYLDTLPTGQLNYLSNAGFGTQTPAFADDLLWDSNTGEMYFIGENTVYKMSQTGSDFSFAPIFHTKAYGLGFDADQQLLYCADAKNFASNGEVFVHKTDGTSVGSFRAGVGPGEILIVK